MINSWEELELACKNCNKCKLCQGRHNVVVEDGNRNAQVMFIGEGPGADEDMTGIPFVGKAGKLMNMALAGVGIKRQEVYIANVVKCKIIVLLGSVALKNILGEEYGITRDRGKWIEKAGIRYMPTFHPAALLRDENKKIEFWQDLKEAKKYIDNNIDWEGKN